MKRSKSLSLLLMGSVALGVTACESEERVEEASFEVFTSVEQCAKSERFTYSDCVGFMQDAIDETPAFSSRQACEAEFGEGSCEAREVGMNSGSSWMPLLVGFMAGNFLARGMNMAGSKGLFKGPTAAGPATAGGAAGQTFRTATGDAVRSDARGRVTGASPRVMQSMTHNARPAMTRSGTGSRGGFSGGGSYGAGS